LYYLFENDFVTTNSNYVTVIKLIAFLEEVTSALIAGLHLRLVALACLKYSGQVDLIDQ